MTWFLQIQDMLRRGGTSSYLFTGAAGSLLGALVPALGVTNTPILTGAVLSCLSALLMWWLICKAMGWEDPT